MNGNKTTHKEFSLIGKIVTVGSYNFEVVRDFFSLGSRVDTSNNSSLKIKRRTTLANKCRALSLRINIKHFKPLIMSNIIRGTERWTTSNKGGKA